MIHKKERFVQNILNWYDANARRLPWRIDVCAYHTWVSEIMLQQTRVEAVIPFYTRFIKRLPKLADLAVIDDDELAKLWEGLGYYSRVRNMKKCAQVCVERYNGELPSTYEELIQLPGIGPYSGGAIASIAYKQCVPAIDGNVLRVFSRVLLSEDDILKEATKKKFQSIVSTYIPFDRPDAFNQALMEIGAMICIPNGEPKCKECPLVEDCKGYASGNPSRLPNKTPKKARRVEKKTVILIVHDRKVVLNQRPKAGLLANLYEFKTIEHHLEADEVLRYIEQNYKALSIKELPESKHLFSHIEWLMKGYLVEVESLKGGEITANIEELNRKYAIPTAYQVYRKAIDYELRKK